MKAIKSAVFSSLMTGFSAASLGISGLSLTGLGLTASLGAALGNIQPAAAAASCGALLASSGVDHGTAVSVAHGG